jgi:hypothetical protein
MILLITSFITFLLNIPFGYWRANVRRYSLQWVLAIHIPVPIIILLRIYSNIGFELYTYPILIGAFFLGQFLGKYLSERRKTKTIPTTSCMIMDLYKSFTSN